MDRTHTSRRPCQRMTKRTSRMWRYSQERQSIGEKKLLMAKFIIHILTTAQAPTKTTEKNMLTVNKIQFLTSCLKKEKFELYRRSSFSSNVHSIFRGGPLSAALQNAQFQELLTWHLLKQCMEWLFFNHLFIIMRNVNWIPLGLGNWDQNSSLLSFKRLNHIKWSVYWSENWNW